MRTCNELGVCQSRECFDCLPSVRVIQETAIQWGLQPQVPHMLRQAGAQCAPGQEASLCHVGGNRSIQAGPFAGIRFGVRTPTPDETTLSADEVLHAMREGIL